MFFTFSRTRKGLGNKAFPNWNPQSEFTSDEENSEFQGIYADGTNCLYFCLFVKGLNEMSLWRKVVDFVDNLIGFPAFKKVSRPVSRVLSWTAIYLGLLLPTASCDFSSRRDEQPLCPLSSCFRWGLQSLLRYRRSGGLLPHLSILTCPKTGGLFLLHFP